MILFFDTETTGLVDYRMPESHEWQPHLVQLAMLLTEDDGTEVSSVSIVVDPGVDIPLAASSVHGITTDKAKRCGLSAPVAVAIFERMLRKASIVVAHNIKFDCLVMITQWARHSLTTIPLNRVFGDKKKICTMEAALQIVNLPPTERMLAAGIEKPKPPKLSECIQHFFGEELEGAHDALVDVHACKRVYFKLQEQGHIK